MREVRKQAVSLRIGTADLRKVKTLALRLGARESDVIRFALKAMLAHLAPLCDESLSGRALLPVFIEAGADFFDYFDLDTARLEQIVNNGVAKGQEVDPDDLKLISMAGMQEAYPKLRRQALASTGKGQPNSMEDTLSGRLRSYLYSKYVDEEPISDAAND